jgi:prepilin-type N-terminal cleavage/methylation domain-containing protein
MMTRNGTKDVADNAYARGFTLIEVLTAVALTAGLMLGVIQIFKMSTDAAGQTEQASDAMEMGRGVMTQLESDLGEFAPEGYLWVRCQEMDPLYWGTTVGSAVSMTASDGGRYRFDSLAFSVAFAAPTTTSGGAAKSNPVFSNAGFAAGGQVAYTFGQRNSAVPALSSYYSPYMGTLNNCDQRGVVLVRKVYLNQSSPGSGGWTVCLGQDQTGTGSVNSTVNVASNYALTQNAAMIQAATESTSATSTLATWVLAPHFRLSPASFYYAMQANGGAAYWQPIINVPDPSIPAAGVGSTSNLSELDNIVCDRVSEFFVDVWNGGAWVPNRMTMPTGTPGYYVFPGPGGPSTLPQPYYLSMTTGAPTAAAGGSWGAAAGTGYLASGYGTTRCFVAGVGATSVGIAPDSQAAVGSVTLLRDNMLWLGLSANPLNRYDKTGLSASAGDLPPPSMPSMIRVTLVVHPHSDQTPLSREPYFAGSSLQRYRGVVFREIFKLSGTVH